MDSHRAIIESDSLTRVIASGSAEFCANVLSHTTLKDDEVGYLAEVSGMKTSPARYRAAVESIEKIALRLSNEVHALQSVYDELKLGGDDGTYLGPISETLCDLRDVVMRLNEAG